MIELKKTLLTVSFNLQVILISLPFGNSHEVCLKIWQRLVWLSLSRILIHMVNTISVAVTVFRENLTLEAETK